MRVLAAIASLVVTLAIALACERTSDACSCGPPPPACEVLRHIDTAFVGTPRSDAPGPGGRTIELEVHEVLRGAVGASVTIASSGGGSCDYGGYTVGERMLVLASLHDGKLRVSSCLGSGPVADAGPLIAELRKAGAARTGSVSGEVGVVRFPILDTERLPNTTVRLRGTPYATKSDAKGKFRFDVPPGIYDLDLDPDPDFEPFKPQQVEVRAGGCLVDQYVSHLYNGRIAGALRDKAGAPLANVTVCVTALGDTKCPRSARSDAAGKYELRSLAPGAYRVGVALELDPTEPFPTTIYPAPVTVGRGTATTGIDLVLPPQLKTRTIAVRVTSRDKTLTWAEASIELRELGSGRRRRASVKFGSTIDLVELDGTRAQISACWGSKCSPERELRLDRDTAIDLLIPTK